MKAEHIPLAIIKLSDYFYHIFNDRNLNGEVEVVLLGSQAILKDYKYISNDFLLSSIELDIEVSFSDTLKHNKKETENILAGINFSYGLQSPLHDQELFYIDLVSETYEEIQKQFQSWPTNWRERSTKETINRGIVTIHFINPDPHDICALKLNASREKDFEYVKTLIQGSIINKKRLFKSLYELPYLRENGKFENFKNKINHFFTLPQINIYKNK